MKQALHLMLLAFLFTTGNAQEKSITENFILANYAKVVDAKPANATEYIYKGLSYEALDESLIALNTFLEGVNKYPNNTSLQTKLASAYSKRGEYTKALHFYIPLYKKDTLNLSLIYAIADIHVEESKNWKAISMYKMAINRGIDNPMLYERMAEAYKGVDQGALVLWCYNQALKRDRGNMRYAVKVVQWNYAEKEFDNAISIADQYLSKHPDHVILNKYKGLSLTQKKRFKEALPCLEYYLEKGNRQSVVLMRTAMCHYALQQYKGVPELCKEYYTKEDPNPEIDFMLGVSLREVGDTLGAITYLSRAKDGILPKPKKLGAFYFELANAYRMHHDYEESIEYYNLGFETDTADQKQCLFFKASVLTNDLKNKEAGLQAFKDFLAVLPPKGDIKKETYTVSLREVAERRVTSLTEELFFKKGNE